VRFGDFETMRFWDGHAQTIGAAGKNTQSVSATAPFNLGVLDWALNVASPARAGSLRVEPS